MTTNNKSMETLQMSKVLANGVNKRPIYVEMTDFYGEEDPEAKAERECNISEQQNDKLDIVKDNAERHIRTRKTLPAKMNGMVFAGRAEKNQRRSRTGKGRGSTKKEGAGGKYTWGTAGQLYEEPDLDPNDPNYDSDAQFQMPFNEPIQELNFAQVDKLVQPIVLEFYANGELREAVDSLRELSLSHSARQHSMQLLVQLALDHSNDARELTSELLAELVHRRLFSQDDMVQGMLGLLSDILPDLVVDCPMAAHLVGNFLARAQADLAFPNDLSKLRHQVHDNPYSLEALERADTLGKHREQLHDIWGLGGGRRPVRFLSKQMHTILQEYLASGDAHEAGRCLRELEVPHFNHEFVYQAGVLAVESMHERSVRVLAHLLSSLSASGQLSSDAIEQGFDRLFANLSDLSIDVPPAFALAEWWTKSAVSAGFLPTLVAGRLPRKGRKRFVSEGCNGKLRVSDVAHPYI